MGWIISKKDIPYISLGAKLLSSGGGGETKTVEYLLLSMMKDTDVIIVKTAVEVMDEWIVPVAIVGSTVLFNEDLPSGSEAVETVALHESLTGKKAEAVISIEIGGINGLIPLLVALERNIPIVDGDGMGRAFPKLEMTTFFDSQVSVFPLAAYSKAETLVARNNQQLQEVFSSFVLKNSGYCHMACFGMVGHQLKAALVPGSLKLSRDIGKALSTGTIEKKVDLLRNLFFNSVYGELEVVFSGRIFSIDRWFEEEALVGSCHLEGQLSFHGKSATIYFQNEFLSIVVSKEKTRTTPDLIIFLHYESGMPISVSDIREGMLVLILVVPAPSVFYTNEMLKLVGPKAFRIPSKFVQPEKMGDVPSNENWN